MSIEKRTSRLINYSLEPDRLRKVLTAASAQADLIKQVRLEMQYMTTASVRETLLSEKQK